MLKKIVLISPICVIMFFSCQKTETVSDNFDSTLNNKISESVNLISSTTDTTVRITASSQAFKNTSSGYSSNSSFTVGMTAWDEFLGRSRFIHTNIPNSSIKKVQMYLVLKRNSTTPIAQSPAVQMQIPYNACNSTIPFSGSLTSDQYYNLNRCIKNAFIVATYRVPSQNSNNITFTRYFDSTSAPNLQTLLQHPNYFTFGMFSPVTDGVANIVQLYVDVTYSK